MKKSICLPIKIALAVFVTYVLVAQGCMTMRTGDKDAIASFSKVGIELSTGVMTEMNRGIHYVKVGVDTNATLFFVHGSPGSWDAFDRYLKDKDLLSRFRMISIDRPGFGHSDFGRGISIVSQCKLIGEMIKQMQNGKPFYIIGHSLGGPLCVKLAADYPSCVNGVLLLAASVDPDEEKPERWRPLMKLSPFRWLLPGAFRPSNDELWYFKKDVKIMPAALNAINCSVTIMQGLKDSMVPPGNAYYAEKQLTHAKAVRLIAMPDANHFIPWTRFAMIKSVLMQFKAK